MAGLLGILWRRLQSTSKCSEKNHLQILSLKRNGGVDSTVTSNYQTIVDYIWMVTKGSVSIEPLNVYGQDQLLLYPNPAVSTVQIQTKSRGVQPCHI